MKGRFLLYGLSLSLIMFLSGCATVKSSDKDNEIQSLRNQVSLLESQVQSKDEELSNLKSSLDKVNEETQKAIAKTAPEGKCRMNIKDIQKALLNAGYNPGAVDGKMGKQTREAIKAFQKTNNLKVDGKVGKETWEVLKTHLEAKVK